MKSLLMEGNLGCSDIEFVEGSGLLRQQQSYSSYFTALPNSVDKSLNEAPVSPLNFHRQIMGFGFRVSFIGQPSLYIYKW
jgi:hypothetical protein